jgi:hypothetical protein
MGILENPIFWIVVAAASEIIGITPSLKANSILQLVMQILTLLRPKKP